MKYLYIFLGLVGAVLILAVIQERSLLRATEPLWVITFAPRQADYFGLNPRTVYQALLNDFKPKHLRLQANWNDIESVQDKYNFEELDWLIKKAGDSGATVTLAMGRKLPRWPECHNPTWSENMKPWEVDERVDKMLSTVVERYRNNPVVTRWQLENEPLFAFGNCTTPNWHKLKQERDLIKLYDPIRPILLTDSGELSPWWETSILGDEQGTTMYRVTWDRMLGYFYYPWPAYFYRLKAALVKPLVKQTVISELQMEPWAPYDLKTLSITEAQKSFSVERFWANAQFAKSTGLPEAFLWGVEWWYFARDKGDATYWDAGKQLFGQTLVK